MKLKTFHICTVCGMESGRWHGQCPGCGEWNTMKSETAPVNRKGLDTGGKNTPVVLDSPTPQGKGASPVSTGMPETDKILGGGLIPGAAILAGGEPGIGKSTLFLQITANVAASGKPALYVTGEESINQLRDRTARLGLLTPNLSALATTRVEDVLDVLKSPSPPVMIVIDSVQTLTSDRVDGLPGSVSQVRAVSTALVESAKQRDCPIILIGHVTKDGQIAGPKLLEHMVDTVIYLEGDRQHLFRLLRVMKNRFGPTFDLLVFQMTEKGMELVHDPSTYFLEARNPGLSGTALVMAVDGNRPFAVEVQALAGRSFLAMPRRTALGFDPNRLHLLLAVLEKRLGINLGQSDIYAKIGGGLQLREPGMDLGLIAAVLSSFYDRPLPEKSVFWGEVDLNGQIRPVIGHEMRLKQAQLLSCTPIIAPAGGEKPKRPRIIDVTGLNEFLFSR